MAVRQLYNIDTKLSRINTALQALEGAMADCRICPRECGVNRAGGQLGFCRLSQRVRIYKYKLHFGEEPPISGTRGSGIIFSPAAPCSACFARITP